MSCGERRKRTVMVEPRASGTTCSLTYTHRQRARRRGVRAVETWAHGWKVIEERRAHRSPALGSRTTCSYTELRFTDTYKYVTAHGSRYTHTASRAYHSCTYGPVQRPRQITC